MLIQTASSAQRQDGVRSPGPSNRLNLAPEHDTLRPSGIAGGILQSDKGGIAMQRPTQSYQVVADFFAQGYRVSGAFMGENRSLSDVIYDLNTDFLLIQDAYLSPIMDPAKISGYYAQTTLLKANMDFVLTMDMKDGLRRDQRFALGDHSFNVSLTVPFFELRGRLHLPGRSFEPRRFLSSEAGRFITLLEVSARCTFNPDVSYQGGAALINHNAISFLGEQKANTA
jgi:hypothetical protein